jgi:hypothetical protein
MEQKIVVHMKGGKIHKGVTNDFDPGQSMFHLLPAEGGGVPMRIALGDMKAMFYVKDYLGNRDYVSQQRFERVQRSGRKVILTFCDGETLYGTIAEEDEKADRFYVYPADERDNNIRLFVTRDSLRDFQLVP